MELYALVRCLHLIQRKAREPSKCYQSIQREVRRSSVESHAGNTQTNSVSALLGASANSRPSTKVRRAAREERSNSPGERAPASRPTPTRPCTFTISAQTGAAFVLEHAHERRGRVSRFRSPHPHRGLPRKSQCQDCAGARGHRHASRLGECRATR